MPGHADEVVQQGEAADDYLARIARAKLDAVAKALRTRNDIWSDRAPAVLVADTSVIVDGEILGKPADVREAEAMISRLAGRTHDVKTRFALARLPHEASASPAHEETVCTEVTFRALSDAEVRAYAESGEGLDKAGAYAVQGRGAALVPSIRGSYTNVVGLPACEVMLALRGMGLIDL
jgi:septum formation protein